MNEVQDASKRYSNIKVIKAYMPEMFGTHHTKAMVLFRHDDLAQVVILTANFIERDFRMSQAIWRTPLLALQKESASPNDPIPPLGSGVRFKHDLLAYFHGYSRNGKAILRDLISKLQDYDFSAVRGALIGSLPGLQKPGQLVAEDQDRTGRWGLPALKRILGCIPSKAAPSLHGPIPQPQIVVQVSSIASVGEKWLLSTLIPTVSTTAPVQKPLVPLPKPKTSIIFPTATTIRNCVDGYGSGGSIHMKTSTPTQAKQLAVLKPMLCDWSSPSTLQTSNTSSQAEPVRQAGRGLAAPHIKTYIRFSSAAMDSIDWAMMTSANLSTQAWGSSPNASGEVKICSYELGVVVWPALWDDDAEQGSGTARMVPVFGSEPTSDDQTGGESGKEGVTVGWRMPYDLPLVPYGEDEKPWCATEACNEPDWMGRIWPGYGH